MSNNTNNDTNKSSTGVGTKIFEIVTSVLTAENVQTYMLGTKKNGKPRAIYDIVKDETSRKKKKKKKKQDDTYSLYLGVKKKNKKKKKHKKGKHWKFD